SFAKRRFAFDAERLVKAEIELCMMQAKGRDNVLMGSEGIIVSAGLQRLRESPYGAVRRLSCEFADGVLTLRGNVASFFHKQVAQQSVVGLEGVDQVDNQIEVAGKLR
ncbi:MAG TPA: BON domain-containing protein, partial [Planctomycetaceae bacterium]